jgi:aminopeptidase-like protein
MIEIGHNPGGAAIGQELYRLVEELYPICRSITGDGVRETLRRLQAHLPLATPRPDRGGPGSSTPAFDWTVPKEWNIRGAYIKNARGETLLDFRDSNLHVVSYSVPVHRRLPLAELKQHLHTIPEQPELIPYRTSYYKETWGFCMPHARYVELRDEEYEVCIDSTLAEGHLTYGECFIPGETADEVLISCHICHPSLCNDNLSGVAMGAMLGRHLSAAPRRYSYRVLFIPGTIGSITWLSRNEARVGAIKHGLVLTCVGDPGAITYKRSRRGDAEIDRAFAHLLKHTRETYQIIDFFPYGYDERQYCSPGFNLPVGCLMRTPHGQFREYHTSADNLDLVRPEALHDSFELCVAALDLLERNRVYLNTNPKCEPQLGKRGLYGSVGGYAMQRYQLAMLWVLNLADGRHSLLDIAERAGEEFGLIADIAGRLAESGLLVEAQTPTHTH